jgi:hypothetical protein
MCTIMNWYRPSGRKLKLADIPNKTYGQLVGDRDCYDTFVIVREYSSYNNNQQNYNDDGFEVICPRVKISYDNSGRKTIEYGNDLFTTLLTLFGLMIQNITMTENITQIIRKAIGTVKLMGITVIMINRRMSFMTRHFKPFQILNIRAFLSITITRCVPGF